MDDPLFDPWAPEPDSPAPPSPSRSSSAPGRWRAPAGPPPSVPRPSIERAPGPAGDAARTRLPGTAGFLRTMAVPRLHDIALRLQMARHDARVEDALDQVPPAVSLVVRPWSGPWSDDDVPVDGMLELTVSPGAAGEVVARVWLGASHDQLADEVTVTSAKLGASWLEGRVLDFLARLLAR